MKKVVDSSVWLEYFADSVNAENFADAIEDYKNLLVPAICLYEISKKYLSIGSKDNAIEAVAHMGLGEVVEVSAEIATLASELTHEEGLPMADSLILATARLHGAVLLTQDADFKGLDGVEWFEKR